MKKDEAVSKNQAPPTELINISLLMLLYILQGVPLGISSSIPMILQNKSASYKDQAWFSLATWPFSIKLLWAPLVDSCFSDTMGRRKSWLVPAQYLIGLFMWTLSCNMEAVLPSEGPPNVLLITLVFFALNFLAATQDIAVDGWALTMLSRARVGWASTCNSVGQTAGFFLGYVVFMALESESFCVGYLGMQGAAVTLAGYLYFWSIVFVVTTSLVWLLKREKKAVEKTDELELGLVETYRMLGSILSKSNIQWTVAVLLTCKIGFAATDALTALKITEQGVPKEQIAMLSIPVVPVQIFLPLVISRYTAGPRPMEVFIRAIPYRLMFSVVFAALVYVTPWFRQTDGTYPLAYFAGVTVVYLIHQVTTNAMFVAVMAFFARVSDPSVGGTYMTLLNTFCNLGGNWPAWAALEFVSDLTYKTCSPAPEGGDEQVCTTLLDGYYVEVALCLVLGLGLWRWTASVVRGLEDLPPRAWVVGAGGEGKDKTQ